MVHAGQHRLSIEVTAPGIFWIFETAFFYGVYGLSLVLELCLGYIKVLYGLHMRFREVELKGKVG